MNIDNRGSVNVSSEVIAKIAGLAALEIDGVIGLRESIVSGLARLLGRADSGRGVQVRINEDCVEIDVDLTVRFGVPIPEVSFRVQQNVKSAVEKMTGMIVTQVNVNVRDVQSISPDSPAPAGQTD